MGPEVDITQITQMNLKPLTDIHLHSNAEYEIEPNGSVANVYIFTAIALLILMIACINFMNLSTARSVDRAKEVGLRKTVGANRMQLIMQFLGESILLSFIALLLALFLIETLLPVFNSVTGKELTISFLDRPFAVLNFAMIALLVGIFSGSYPAFFLSTLHPVTVLKGKFKTSSRGTILKKILSVAQFAVSISLIIGTIIVMNQLDYLRNKKLGFDKEHVVLIPINDSNLIPRIASLKNEISQNLAVVSVAASQQIPGERRFIDTMFRKDGGGRGKEDLIGIYNFSIDNDFLPTIRVEFVSGRNFSQEFSTDAASGFIINEAAVKKFGWESAETAIGRKLDKTIGLDPLIYKEGTVIGVVKNFHYESLHQKIEPIIMELNPNKTNYIVARIRPENISRTVSFLKNKMQAFSPNYPFEYVFQDDYFDRLYGAEEKLQEIFGYFTFLAIFIACLGLFALSSFAAEQRTKEIGIRKVLGATVATVVALLSKDFVKLVLLANLLAWPVAWIAMNKWLQNFAYRIEISWWVFALAGGLALVIAVLTVSTQAMRAALANPVESLRYE